MGIHATHSPDFAIDRPGDPYGTCLILCFRSPALVFTGLEIETAAIGDCIVHRVDFRQCHHSVHGAQNGYSNDWIHVDPNVLEPMMDRWQLPFNRLIATGNPDALTRFIRMIQDELITADEFTDPLITCHLENMIISLARNRKTMIRQKTAHSAAERRYFQLFRKLRQHIILRCDNKLEIAELAAKTNLSPERFSVLYRKFFAASPYAEIIEARLVRAKQLLLGTSMDIKEVAAACGWDNQYYFSKLFKTKTGMPPSIYRNQTPPDNNHNMQ